MSLALTNYRPYLQPMSGLGQQGRTLGAIIYGGPRAGAGSAVRIYNFYHNLPEPFQSRFLANLRKNALIVSGNRGNFSLFQF